MRYVERKQKENTGKKEKERSTESKRKEGNRSGNYRKGKNIFWIDKIILTTLLTVPTLLIVTEVDS
jgi:hypothetical protein